MKFPKRLWQICMNIYSEMYRKADPPADFRRLMKEGETGRRDWFEGYYLDMETQKSIVEKHCKRNHLTKWERSVVGWEVWLGCSPTTVRRKTRERLPLSETPASC